MLLWGAMCGEGQPEADDEGDVWGKYKADEDDSETSEE